MYFTYVLYSPPSDKIYIGFTSDLSNRLLAHNDSRNTGWSSRYQPWELLYSEEYSTKSEAMAREKQLKTYRGRAFIRGIIQSKHISHLPGC